ncbi:uncharacterized protein L969DRAFT_79207 [Mixia osmundae IAM 14324]|uniref:Uncharacterized protein n=1 Tax=Mixia osmundae (strain CBS 9802 / IAM 14324 / JCM 22182 / KY 12970) TaxID=764103 RepID=G7E298_MIXOS|nr:uncharacterized protein L969DRAFT_79207 [Mixia osmundae IAM 14324]KEI36831.1 hypothetical protein L969DRAFT_79207 [Mixia osmundae IAM 14324]GAA96958.1 hypothetical protein E5Q_03632 [Mixia osmundae IAM 14324]
MAHTTSRIYRPSNLSHAMTLDDSVDSHFSTPSKAGSQYRSSKVSGPSPSRQPQGELHQRSASEGSDSLSGGESQSETGRQLSGYSRRGNDYRSASSGSHSRSDSFTDRSDSEQEQTDTLDRRARIVSGSDSSDGSHARHHSRDSLSGSEIELMMSDDDHLARKLQQSIGRGNITTSTPGRPIRRGTASNKRNGIRAEDDLSLHFSPSSASEDETTRASRTQHSRSASDASSTSVHHVHTSETSKSGSRAVEIHRSSGNVVSIPASTFDQQALGEQSAEEDIYLSGNKTDASGFSAFAGHLRQQFEDLHLARVQASAKRKNVPLPSAVLPTLAEISDSPLAVMSAFRQDQNATPVPTRRTEAAFPKPETVRKTATFAPTPPMSRQRSFGDNITNQTSSPLQQIQSIRLSEPKTPAPRVRSSAVKAKTTPRPVAPARLASSSAPVQSQPAYAKPTAAHSARATRPKSAIKPSHHYERDDALALPDQTYLTEIASSPNRIRSRVHLKSARPAPVEDEPLAQALSQLKQRLVQLEDENRYSTARVKELEQHPASTAVPRQTEQTQTSPHAAPPKTHRETLNDQLRQAQDRRQTLAGHVQGMRGHVEELDQSIHLHRDALADLQKNYEQQTQTTPSVQRTGRDKAWRGDVLKLQTGLDHLASEVREARDLVNRLATEQPTPRPARASHHATVQTAVLGKHAGIQTSAEAFALSSSADRHGSNLCTQVAEAKRTLETVPKDHGPHNCSECLQLQREQEAAEQAEAQRLAELERQRLAELEKQRRAAAEERRKQEEAEAHRQAQAKIDAEIQRISRVKAQAEAAWQRQQAQRGADEDGYAGEVDDDSRELSRSLLPQTIISRAIQQKEEDFWGKISIYEELSATFTKMDPAANPVKRKTLAAHLQESIEVIEIEAAEIRRFYELLEFTGPVDELKTIKKLRKQHLRNH